MALWGATDNAANAPKWTVASGLNAANSTGYAPRGSDLYQNTATSAWKTGLQLGIEGVNTVEIADTTLQNSNGAGFGKAAHTGWNLRKQGTGYVSSVSISSGGQGYNANAYIIFTGGGGISGSNANASYTIANSLNSSQSYSSNALQNTIVTVTLNSPGSNYTSAPTATAQGGNISAATFTVTMGGRVGRVQFETLVALTNVA
jgi:hypothetical protein